MTTTLLPQLLGKRHAWLSLRKQSTINTNNYFFSKGHKKTIFLWHSKFTCTQKTASTIILEFRTWEVCPYHQVPSGKENLQIYQPYLSVPSSEYRLSAKWPIPSNLILDSLTLPNNSLFFYGILIFSKFSAPTIAFLAFWLAKKLRLWANSRSFTSYEFYDIWKIVRQV